MQDFFHQACEIVAAQQALRDAWKPTGVCWSGITHNPAPEVDTVEHVQAKLEAEAERYTAWKTTPTGRFVCAAKLICDATGDERLLQCWTRGLDTNHDFATKLLTEMEGPAADQARAALQDWKDAR